MAILTGRMSSSIDVAVSRDQNETGFNTSRFKPSLPLGADLLTYHSAVASIPCLAGKVKTNMIALQSLIQ